jgi:hypothetical protein
LALKDTYHEPPGLARLLHNQEDGQTTAP